MLLSDNNKSPDSWTKQTLKGLSGVAPGDFKVVRDKFAFRNEKDGTDKAPMSALANESRLKAFHAGQTSIGLLSRSFYPEQSSEGTDIAKTSCVGLERLKRLPEAIMTEILLNMKPVSASSDDTILVISPNIELVENIRNFSVQRNMNLWIGDPNSPDVIAVPYKVGILDKYCMDPRFWGDWLEFLRETKGCRHDHLLIIILPAPFSEAALIEIKKEFEDAHEPVSFIFGTNGGQVVEIMDNWLNTGPIEPVSNDATSTIVPAVSGKVGQMTFRDRLDELINRFTFEDTKAKVNLNVYFKFRIQAKWLLAKYLGENHLYTKELNTTVAVDMDPYAVGSYLLAAKGVLEALIEDMDRGLIELKEGA